MPFFALKNLIRFHFLVATALLLLRPTVAIGAQVSGGSDPAANPSALAQAGWNTHLDGAVEPNGVFTLAPGPKVEGVVFLQGGHWSETDIKTFHEVEWVDAASVRLSWAEFERADQQFDWEPFDRMLAEVKKYNAAHASARRVLQIRVMGGRHCPGWFERAGVRYYDTTHPKPDNWAAPLHAPLPYDNPEFLKQMRQMYRAMFERYQAEPLVMVYHGTWSAGPWDEIFHPLGSAPLPPGYTREKFVQGMLEQLDVLLEEFSLKGKVAELPFTGHFPDQSQLDLLEPLLQRVVNRLGRRSPYLYIQSNGWGLKEPERVSTIAWGHERDIQRCYGRVNLAFQALGSNAGKSWLPQGDWVSLIRLAERYEVAYTELYAPDFRPLDVPHRIVEAFTQAEAQATNSPPAIPGFIGFRPWLQQQPRTLYVRDGVVVRAFRSADGARPMARLVTAASVPKECAVSFRARTRAGEGDWSGWAEASRVTELPPGVEVQIEARLHTDDGYFTPRIVEMYPEWKWSRPKSTNSSPRIR